MAKVRIDKLLMDRSLVPSGQKAQSLIMTGRVLVNEMPVTKAGQMVDPLALIRIAGSEHPYVGRGGIKLAHAISEFHMDIKGKICVDVGSSTGGFTDCLLQNGAARVYAIDVGYGQLDWKLRNDPRVVVMERTNIRKVNRLLGLQVTRLDMLLDMAVIDVSFISLGKVFPHVDKLLKSGAMIVALIKPQFEAGRALVGKGGIVRDESVRQECVVKVCSEAERIGWLKKGVIQSPITGADGNVEFLAWFVKTGYKTEAVSRKL